MANHVTKVKLSGDGVIGTCTCKMKQAKPVKTSQEAEDWIIWHEDQVRRAQAASKTEPRLTTVYNTYKANAEDSTLPAKERELWRQLADEVATRLGLNAPPSEQLSLLDTKNGARR